ncbi:MAG: hypothetical protein IPO92_18455 [Saprospiraceae bacterium]|nr:hypothetical protein [Saprospiraceae bacterium]
MVGQVPGARSSFTYPQLLHDTFDAFYYLYTSMALVGKYLNGEDDAKMALSEIDLNGPNDDDLFLEWLMKYEKLGSKLSLVNLELFDESNPSPIPTYITLDFNYSDVKFESQEFKSILQFVPFFIINYDSMLRKYGSISLPEKEIFCLMEEDWRDGPEKYSLTYHVHENRKHKS